MFNIVLDDQVAIAARDRHRLVQARGKGEIVQLEVID